MTDVASTDRLPSAGVLRRLGAMFYDLLAILALMMVVTAALLPITGGEAITSDRYGAWEYAYQALLVAIVIAFFGLFWTRRGQTLGMLAWRLRVEREDGSLLSWSDVFKRLAAATVSLTLAFAGYLWIWIDRDRQAWPDRWTRTRVVVLPKRG
ncbi:RDD family protein [Steroidobacter sp. S1-65]|uniref:RDD family protein n=1 Tax=Steroidobacter gossypii TaxID=2805490 RepID=A0ABS1X689_9GAMM|nr:RDD family protein [Steroidobacter gossypii]MBM0108744.1 RDD family protein [Steroidobacter gossypii]